MASKASAYAWTRCRGRNGWDSPLDVPMDQGTEVLNMHFYVGGLGTKRSGSSDATPAGSYAGIHALARFVPGQNDSAAELFLVSGDVVPLLMRVAGSAAAVAVVLLDPILGRAVDVTTAVLNGKLYLAYDSSVNRLHVYDPTWFTGVVRRTGLAPPAAPTVSNPPEVGTYAATARYYKVAYIEQRGVVTARRSNLSLASAVFTPSGTSTAARVARPPLLGEGETDWEVYGSSDDTTYYGPLATLPASTTTVYDDVSLPSDWAALYDAEPVIGAGTPFPSVRFLYANGTRLFGLGAYETTAGDSLPPKAGRVYFTPVLDSSSVHDDERIENTITAQGWIDLARNAAGIDRGLGALGNVVYAFQSRGIYALNATENAELPFRRIVVSTVLGAVSHQSIVPGEDEAGRAALYFLDPELGPYRLGANGLQWIGKDVKDLWDTVNHAASSVVAHGIYHKAKHQIHWFIATGTSNDPNTTIVFDVTEGTASQEGVRYGWSRYSGRYAAARCSVMFATTIGAVMSRALSPYVGLVTGTVLLRGDDAAMTTDAGTAYQAYIQSGAFSNEPLFENKAVLQAYVHAPASQDVTLAHTFIRGLGDDQDRVAHLSLTADGTETDVFRKVTGAVLTGAYAFQVRIGDAVATAKLWTLNRWYGQVETREQR